MTRNDIGLLLLRVTVGVVLCLHGLEKFFGFGPGSLPFSQLGSAFTQSGWKSGDMAAIMVAASESVGGALLVTGMLTPIGACAVMATMIDATLQNQSAHDGIEYTLVLAAAAGTVLLLGPGRISVDGRFGRDQWPAPVSYGLIAVGFAAAIATWVLLKGTNPLAS